jgi:hypothetical protein
MFTSGGDSQTVRMFTGLRAAISKVKSSRPRRFHDAGVLRDLAGGFIQQKISSIRLAGALTDDLVSNTKPTSAHSAGAPISVCSPES